jgi:hypothetical protein
MDRESFPICDEDGKTFHSNYRDHLYERERFPIPGIDCQTYRCYPCRYVIYTFIGGAGLIILYKIALHYLYGRDFYLHDILNIRVTNTTWLDGCYSTWPFSHFIFYALIGYFFPHCWKIAIVVGVIWEVVETLLGAFSKQFFPDGDAKIASVGAEYSINWWRGSGKDILFNIAGFSLGAVIRYLMEQYHCPSNPDRESPNFKKRLYRHYLEKEKSTSFL